MTFSLKSIDRFSQLLALLQELKIADAQILACAQSQANHRNISESYQILSTLYPQYAEKLNLAKQDLENAWFSDERKCVHPLFPSIRASYKKQNPKEKNSWPNWILSIDEKF